MIKHNDIIIEHDQPFKNCKLDRLQYAEVLTDIVSSNPDGFVMAINNEWGTGKTTFVKMWEQHLKNQEYKTLYFNAWENDFEEDVLVALISELASIKETKSIKAFKTVLEKAAPLAKNIALGIVKTQFKKHAGKEVLKEVLDAASETTSEELQKLIDKYKSRKESINDFKKSLTDFVKKSSVEKPVVFIIDELDRCRPDYAVEVLEQVKHLFSVQGIIFVLSIDKIQLENAIRGYYGSDKINAEEYLRRFIDIEYTIPEPDIKVFCRYLIEYFQFQEFFRNEKRLEFPELKNDLDLFSNFVYLLLSKNTITLRKIEKLLAHARLALNSVQVNHYIIPEVFILLIYLRTFHNDVYSHIKKGNYKIQNLISNIEDNMPRITNNNDLRRLIYAEFFLLKSYIKDHENLKDQPLLEKKINEEPKLLFRTKLDPSSNSQVFIEIMEAYEKSRFQIQEISLNYFINKIELVDKFQFSKKKDENN